jgi:hypothetical protein
LAARAIWFKLRPMFPSILIDVLGYQRWVEGPKSAVASHSRGLEGRKPLPMQMDLALKREKEIKSNGKTKS